MRHSLVAACTLAVVLGACARVDDPEKTRMNKPQISASSPSPKVSAKSDACTMLTRQERRSIAGEPVDVVAPLPAVKDVQQCRWVVSLGGPTPTIQVLVMRAQDWARSVPAQIDQVLLAGRANDKTGKRLQAAKREIAKGTDKLSDEEACDLFSLLAGVNGRAEGTRETIAFPPFGGQVSANARTCTGGTFTSMTYSEPGLTASSALGQATLRLMRVAHKRAMERG